MPTQAGEKGSVWKKASDGDVPNDAFLGGFEEEDIYVARAVYEQELIPGKLVPSHGGAYVSWDGGEYMKREYEVLCGINGSWVAASNGAVPDRAVPGGQTKDGEILYVGRVELGVNQGQSLGKQSTSLVGMNPPNAKGGVWKRASNGRVPDGAFVGGFDGENIYVAKAPHAEDDIPGKLVPSHGVAYVAYGGKQFRKTKYEVLSDINGRWERGSDGSIPAGAIPGGISDNEVLYIGRVDIDGVHSIGKVHPSHKLCYVPYAGKEHQYRVYEVLVPV